MVKIFTILLLLAAMAVLSTSCSTLTKDWRTSSRESAGLSVNPSLATQAIIEVYAADAFSWRGWFAVHSWMVIKPQDAKEYTVYEVVGWRVNSGLPALRKISTMTPDRFWYGAKPEKILYIEGDDAARLIPQVEAAIARYPYANEYTLFPGPNSNTFPAWVGLQVPALGLEMPFDAIGSGYAD
ncbi:MAG: hypothetical protein ACJAVV_000152 [Alphaproteobacteria bacterium]|jgi:hypothetical protein